LFSVGRDISLRVAAEERLRTLNDHLEDIVEQRTTELETINERLNKTQKMASLGSWELNLETNILKWSDETCRIYGLLPSNNLLSMDEWFDYVHPKHKEYVKTVVKEANEAKAQASFYYQIIRKDGAVRTLYTLSSFEFNESQIPIGVYGIVQDVTNQPSFNEN
jgi:PAS domain S-box-containing protein